MDAELILTSEIGLSIMTVAPKHQYRGVGSALTKWGTDYADKIGAEVCVRRGPRMHPRIVARF